LCKCKAHSKPHPKWVHMLSYAHKKVENGEEIVVQKYTALWGKLKSVAPIRAYRTARRAFDLGAFTTCKDVFVRYGVMSY